MRRHHSTEKDPKTGLPDTDSPGADRSPGTDGSKALLKARDALILLGGLALGIITGLLTYFTVRNPSEAILASIPSCGGAISFLRDLIGD